MRTYISDYARGNNVKRFLGVIAATAFIIGVATPIQAMGSSDAYENMQVGVTYTVYEPSFTAGLKARHLGGNDLVKRARNKT